MAVDAQNRVINLSLYDAKTLTFNEGKPTPGAQAEMTVQVDLKAGGDQHALGVHQRHDLHPALG